MIRRLYIHNFRCLENFDLSLVGQKSILLVGDNGAGKSTVRRALEILQKIGRGINRVGELVTTADLSSSRSNAPMRFELEVRLDGIDYKYSIAFELPPDFRELRVAEETLIANEAPVFSREMAKVFIAPISQGAEARFLIDWHLAALPIVQVRNAKDPLFVFKQWLARMIILRPIPSLIYGESKQETLEPNIDASNFCAWFSGLLALAPSAYGKIDQYLKDVMPDWADIKNPIVGKESRNLEVQFSNESGELTVPFKDLSDGEKCLMICAMVLAANHAYGPLFCFWDEPESHLALAEVGHFVTALRKSFQKSGQFVATSHNPEAIRAFSNENTFLLHRKSHLEPTMIRRVQELIIHGDFANALIRGDVLP